MTGSYALPNFYVSSCIRDCPNLRSFALNGSPSNLIGDVGDHVQGRGSFENLSALEHEEGLSIWCNVIPETRNIWKGPVEKKPRNSYANLCGQGLRRPHTSVSHSNSRSPLPRDSREVRGLRFLILDRLVPALGMRLCRPRTRRTDLN
jgi:hypothetical protein